MSTLAGNIIDWSTFDRMISSSNANRWIYWAIYELNKDGNKILFKYDRCKIKDFFDFNFIRYNRKVFKTQITCLTKKPCNDEIISYVYRKFERVNEKDNEYYYAYFFSKDMFKLANFMNEFSLDISDGEVKLYKNDLSDEDNSIPLYRNENDIENEDNIILDVKDYSITTEPSAKSFTLYDQIKWVSDSLKEIFKEALFAENILVRNIIMNTEQKAVIFIENRKGILYTPKNKLVYMNHKTLSDIKNLNDNKYYVTKTIFSICEDINSSILSFASKIVLNLIDDKPYVKKNTYYTHEPYYNLQFDLINQILTNNFLNEKEKSLVLIKDVPSDARIFIEKRIRDKETKYLMIITNNDNNLLCYYNDEIKDFVDILLFFKDKFGIEFKN